MSHKIAHYSLDFASGQSVCGDQETIDGLGFYGREMRKSWTTLPVSPGPPYPQYKEIIEMRTTSRSSV